MDIKKIIDISLIINPETIIYPGDAKLKTDPICTIERSGCNMTKLILSTHTATHIDAPFHFLKNGLSIDKLPLHLFMGKVQVVEIEKETIDAQEIEEKVDPHIKRVIFKTPNSSLWEKKNFSKKYCFLSNEGADALLRKQILLVGIDYVSIEQFGTPDFSVHKKLLSQNIPILEGLNLKHVTPGIYFLIAFPLKLDGLDGSPVRAVLLQF